MNKKHRNVRQEREAEKRETLDKQMPKRFRKKPKKNGKPRN